MVTIPSFERVTLPLATIVAAAGATLIALSFLVMPGTLLERLVLASGFPSILAAAEPPLGLTARTALALLGGGSAAGFLWYATYLAVGMRTVTIGASATVDAAAVRRGDAHPDAPPRAPLLANRDLGTPFLDVRAPANPAPAAEISFDPVERSLPLDLDRPLAEFDPRALLAQPLPAPPPVAPLPRPASALKAEAQAAAPSSVVNKAPAVAEPRVPEPAREAPSLRCDPIMVPTANLMRDRADPPATAPRETTIHDLLARLEKGVANDNRAPAQAASLSAALGDLRKLALDRR